MSMFRYLKCIQEINALPDLMVGDLLWKVGFDIEPGGYEVDVLKRCSDGQCFRVRESHIEDCFSVVEVDE